MDPGRFMVSLDPTAVAPLRNVRKSQLKQRLACPPDLWKETGLVFTQEDGSAFHPQTVAWYFRKAQKGLGLPALTLHGLRHTHDTLKAGVPLKVMSKRLGHSSTAITADLYQHVQEGMDQEAAVKIASLYR